MARTKQTARMITHAPFFQGRNLYNQSNINNNINNNSNISHNYINNEKNRKLIKINKKRLKYSEGIDIKVDMIEEKEEFIEEETKEDENYEEDQGSESEDDER